MMDLSDSFPKRCNMQAEKGLEMHNHWNVDKHHADESGEGDEPPNVEKKAGRSEYSVLKHWSRQYGGTDVPIEPPVGAMTSGPSAELKEVLDTATVDTGEGPISTGSSGMSEDLIVRAVEGATVETSPEDR
ncbi:hypothetical protein GE061_008861, partial [Apolygus lucorum]